MAAMSHTPAPVARAERPLFREGFGENAAQSVVRTL